MSGRVAAGGSGPMYMTFWDQFGWLSSSCLSPELLLARRSGKGPGLSEAGEVS